MEIAIWGDVDNDGDLDALTAPFAGGASTSLTAIALNQGDGTFVLAPDGGQGPGQGAGAGRGGAAFVDVDLDGVLDLWLGRGQGAQGPEQDQLYRGRGDGTFEEATQALGLVTRPWANLNDLNQARAHTNAWGVTACDLTNDGWPELLSASYGRAPNHLWYSSASLTGARVLHQRLALLRVRLLIRARAGTTTSRRAATAPCTATHLAAPTCLSPP